MERAGQILVLMLTFQLVYATSRSGGTLGHIKCNCPPVGGGAGGGIGSGSGSPPVGGGGSGSGSPPVRTDPVYSSPPPAGGSTPATPSLTPPYGATPSSPSTPKYTSPPAPTSFKPPSPSKGGSSSPTTPSVPSYGGSPPSPSSSSSPSVPTYGTPPVPSSSSSTAPPVVGTSPSPPTDPGVPSTPRGSTPSVPGLSPGGIIPGLPGSGTGTCNFWGSHPSLFPNILSIFSSISDLFGSGSFFPSKSGKGLTVQEALTNRRKDGYGLLLREGTASLLNSLVNPTFQFPAEEVKNQFNVALRSNKAAAVQGAKFKSANEGRLHY
ncbi:hypothetical protein SUGI_0619820 [Cryptomeria japonica]|nr:hypothetical protein SUGI_0619820 [Cryptomeria japonica]